MSSLFPTSEVPPIRCNQLQGQAAGAGIDNNHLSLPTPAVVGYDYAACNQLHGDLVDSGKVDRYVDACWADATKRAYAGDLRDFAAWGGEMPASARRMARYVAERASKVSPATMARRLVGIGAAHVLAGYLDPTRDPLVGKVLKGVRRTHGVAQRRALPLDPRGWQQAWMQPNGLRSKRDKALLMLGFSAAFRRSELVSLDVEDLCWSDRGLAVRLRKSKTDQEKVSRLVAIPYAGAGPCSVRTVKEWLEASRIGKGALFRSIDGQDRLGPRLHPQSVSSIIKKLAQLEGLSAEHISGHSLRAGFVTAAVEAGVGLVFIQKQTGHASLDALARYIRDLDPFSQNANAQMVLTTDQGDNPFMLEGQPLHPSVGP